MNTLETTHSVTGPWSLETSRRFWEGFTPSRLPGGTAEGLSTRFLNEIDWTPVTTTVQQSGGCAHIQVSGEGNLEQASQQVVRFLSLDIDATGWADVGRRDPVIGDAQRALPGLRPCGFHSPYEAAVWSVLSQRVRIVQAAQLRDALVAKSGRQGAMPAPSMLRRLDLDLPGRKPEYLRAVAEAALEGMLDGGTLRLMPVDDALAQLREIKGIGPFASELILIRGANAPDVLPSHERRLDQEIEYRYGADANMIDISERWRPFRTWAAVQLRVLREERTHEIGGAR